MKIADILAVKRTLSFEFFPPPGRSGIPGVFETMRRLRAYGPDFVSVTHSPDARRRPLSEEVASRAETATGATVMAHLTCIGRTRDQVAKVLEELTASGVKNVIALRGDPPRNDLDFDEANGEFESAVDLVDFIKRRFDMCVAAACYPEGHPDAASLQSDVEHSKRKADAGADLFISQLFFDNADFFEFLNRAQQVGIQIPIIPGLLPIIGARQVRRFTRITGSRIPAELDRKIADHEDDDGAVAELGVEHTTGQLSELLESGIPGVHFYALNRTRSVSQVLQNVGIAARVIS
jgi:methylenetetrahydrofolate reductase (NADPH)